MSGFTYRHVCDGIDVEVAGHVLHIASGAASEAQIADAAAAFRAAISDGPETVTIEAEDGTVV